MSIFKKAEEDDAVEVASPPKIGEARPIRSKNVSVIGPTLVFKGVLSADEDLVIEGQIEGTIDHQKRLVIGKKGRVRADIHASSVIVEGQLVGDIYSKGIVSLANGSDVQGDINCGRVVMEDGARFKGNIDMGERPKIGGTVLQKSMPQRPVPIDTAKIDKISEQ